MSKERVYAFIFESVRGARAVNLAAITQGMQRHIHAIDIDLVDVACHGGYTSLMHKAIHSVEAVYPRFGY
jgi:hypothetical protein